MPVVKKTLLIFAIILSLSTITVYAEDITIDAKGAILVDLNSGEVLYEQNADDKVYPASLTKLMTALIVMEHAALDEVVTVSQSALAGLNPHGSSAGLKVNEQMTVENMLYCLLLPSGNDAAAVLAEHVAGSIPAFVDLMNQKAKELGCTGTHFENPHGLHSEGHYTTARDVFLITREFVKNEHLFAVSNTVTYVVPPTNATSSQRILNSTNYLINGNRTIQYLYSPARGIKTGTTTPAGYCLVSAAEKNDMFLISVVMGASRQAETEKIMSFVETKRLFEWGFRSFARKALIAAGEPVVEVPVDMASDVSSVIAVTQSSIEHLLPVDFSADEVVITPTLDYERLEAPVIKGQILGEADVAYRGRSYGRVKLVALTGVERSDFLYTMDKVKAIVQTPAFLYGVLALIGIIILYTVFMVTINRRKRLRRIRTKGRYL
ncbi:MAG TPA: D-alanyl-D-alanine carboxypeptidase [Clostridiales bacterium]|jgi:D-alanyl-D-alanine carboxypeptidase (penicillin-binding protein 5/6)|nr:D-alanyl-D-alanine carboxypeptidase [Clostridiales bacterium]